MITTLNDIFPPADERMGIEGMILGYTINGAIQLGIEKTKGSIEVGKDADYLVFDKDLLTAEHEGFSYNLPVDVYYSGRKINNQSNLSSFLIRSASAMIFSFQLSSSALSW